MRWSMNEVWLGNITRAIKHLFSPPPAHPPEAVRMSVFVVRAFVQMRDLLGNTKERSKQPRCSWAE